MANLNDLDCRRIFFVDGIQLEKAMLASNLTEKQLARKAGVSEQTIRNYLNSTPAKPWPAKSIQFQTVCGILRIDHVDAQIERDEPLTPNQEIGVFADLRFLGDPKTVRRMDGRWRAENIDVEIPGVVSYTAPTPWSAELTIQQFGNRCDATGIDKDDDGVFACGSLLEDGNWILFKYWIDNPSMRSYGTAMVEYKGCGRKMEGLVMGRDHGHSSTGMAVAKLTLTRVKDESGKETTKK